MTKKSIMPNWLFNLRHPFWHDVVWANSAAGYLLLCHTCDVVNYTSEQEAGRATKFKSFEEWKAYHEQHGEIMQYPGGTFEFYCSKCRSDW
jgi:hypothetical protein